MELPGPMKCLVTLQGPSWIPFSGQEQSGGKPTGGFANPSCIEDRQLLKVHAAPSIKVRCIFSPASNTSRNIFTAESKCHFLPIPPCSRKCTSNRKDRDNKHVATGICYRQDLESLLRCCLLVLWLPFKSCIAAFPNNDRDQPWHQKLDADF